MSACLTVTDRGVPLSAVLERASAGAGPLVIALHGLTSSKDRPHNIAACEAMREAGFSTLRADLYGHGGSGGDFRSHTVSLWVSNTLALIRYAQGLDFVTEIWLAGHSQGGLTAALAGGLMPEAVRGMILRAPAFMIPTGARAGELLGRRFDPERVPDSFAIHDGFVLDGGYLRDARTLRAEEAMARFPGPVLLIHGDLDDVVPLRDSEDAARRYRNAELAVIPGETHHFDRHPDRMRAIITAWLRRQRGATPQESEGVRV